MSTFEIALPEETQLEEAARADRSSFEDLVRRLSRQSVEKYYQAYRDVPWDDPDYTIDSEDPRWELRPENDPLASTDWYRALPQGTRAQIGLYRIATSMKVGLQFESVLKRGLLEYAIRLPNGAPEFRYAYHEVIEEAQHTLMFQEFVNRAGFDIRGLPWHIRLATGEIVKLGRRFPELFFIFVLGGEDPIDYVQREVLRNKRDLHPLTERVMRIHVTEEARHLSFARHYLRARVPQLGVLRRTALTIGAPIILSVMSQLMLKVSPQLVRTFDVPRSVVRSAYSRNPEHRQATLRSMAKVRRLCRELGLLKSRPARGLWHGLGIWAEEERVDAPGRGQGSGTRPASSRQLGRTRTSRSLRPESSRGG